MAERAEERRRPPERPERVVAGAPGKDREREEGGEGDPEAEVGKGGPVRQRRAEEEPQEREPRQARPAREGGREEPQDALAPAGRASSTSITGMSETIG